MNAIAFDLGDTLVEYEGLPPSWVDHYPAALGRLASFLGTKPGPTQIEAACGVLRRYNTRLKARETEVRFSRILNEICRSFSVSAVADDEGAARAFFSVFRQRLRVFPDSRSVLAAFRDSGVEIGVFTDVPYGMPRSLVLEDVNEAGLGGLFDVLVTSVDVGFRKPAPATLAHLGGLLGCGSAEMAYVGNERKDVEAARNFGCKAILLDRGRLNPQWGQDRTIVALSDLLSAQPG